MKPSLSRARRRCSQGALAFILLTAAGELQALEDHASVVPPGHEPAAAWLVFSKCLLAAAGAGVLIFVVYRAATRWRQKIRHQRDEEVFQLINQWTRNWQEEVTKRKAAQAALQESQQFLLQQERLAAVGQLAAGLAHEFNNATTIIQGHAGLLLEDPSLSPDARESAQQISDGVDRVARLVQQMLAFSRKHVMQRKALAVKQLLSTTEETLRQILGEVVALSLDIAQGLPPILADANMFQQILVNLVINGRDSMRSGGQLTIRVREAVLAPADISENSERRAGRYVKLSVSDTGQGMETSVIKHIFEPFFSTKGVGNGNGLGLATVYGMVKQHEGWIEVSSIIGQGTTFDLYFPVTDKEPEKPVAQAPKPAARGGNETILVCEDEQLLRDLLGEILEGQGYHVLAAANGSEALGIWKQRRNDIDLLLTDIALPGNISGHDLAAHIQKEKPSLPIIFSSGHSQPVSSPGQAPDWAYLSKPYRPPQLIQTVREALDSCRKPTCDAPLAPP